MGKDVRFAGRTRGLQSNLGNTEQNHESLSTEIVCMRPSLYVRSLTRASRKANRERDGFAIFAKVAEQSGYILEFS